MEALVNMSLSNVKEKRYLEIANLPDGSVIKLPLLIAHGKAEGKILLALGGIHGDEYEGPEAVREVFESLDTNVMAGKFIGIPVSNPPAYGACRRESPVDGLNLARVFPGRKYGSLTERIAFRISEFIRSSDFLIDLHSAGLKYEAPTLCGYVATSDRAGTISKETANTFGAPVVWEHPPVFTPGRTTSVAMEEGIPCLYTETKGGSWLFDEALECYKNGVLNVMKYLGICPGKPIGSKAKYQLIGGGDIDKDSIRVLASGFLVSSVNVLDKLKEGDLLGRIVDPLGEVLEEVRAPFGGYVVFKRANPIIYSGEWAYLLAQ